MPAGMRAVIVGVVMAASVLVLLAACGGGDSSSTSSGTTDGEALTDAQFVAQGDAVCSQALERFEQLRQSPPSTQEETVVFTEKLIAIQEGALDQLRALEAPADVGPALDRYLKALEKNVAILKQGLEAAQNDDATGYAAAQAKAVKGQVERLQLAQAVGFTECSRPAGTAPTG